MFRQVDMDSGHSSFKGSSGGLDMNPKLCLAPEALSWEEFVEGRLWELDETSLSSFFQISYLKPDSATPAGSCRRSSFFIASIGLSLKWMDNQKKEGESGTLEKR